MQSLITLFEHFYIRCASFISLHVCTTLLRAPSCFFSSRLSYSKNGVIRMDGFSTPDQFDDEALSLWVPGPMEQSHLDQSTAKYILSFIGDKFCQMVATENAASSWIKKDGKFSQE